MWLWVKQPDEVRDLLWNELATLSPQMSRSTEMRRISDMKHRRTNINLALYFQCVLVRAQNVYLQFSRLRTWSLISDRKKLIKSTHNVRNTDENLVLPSCTTVHQSHFLIYSLPNPQQQITAFFYRRTEQGSLSHRLPASAVTCTYHDTAGHVLRTAIQDKHCRISNWTYTESTISEFYYSNGMRGTNSTHEK